MRLLFWSVVDMESIRLLLDCGGVNGKNVTTEVTLSDFREEDRAAWVAETRDLAALPAVVAAIGTSPAEPGELAQRLRAVVPGLRDDSFAEVNAWAIAEAIISEWPRPGAEWWGRPVTDEDRAWDAAWQAIVRARRLQSGQTFSGPLGTVPRWWYVGLVLGFPQGMVSRRTITNVMRSMRDASSVEEGERILADAAGAAVRRAERRKIIEERTGPGRKRESARRSLYPRTHKRTHKPGDGGGIRGTTTDAD